MADDEANSSLPTSNTNVKCDYLSLLEQIDTLEKLSADLNQPSNVIEHTWKVDELEDIFKNIVETIDPLLKQMGLEKRAILICSIMNVIVRVAAVDKSNFIILRKPFQTMYIKIRKLLRIYADNDSLSPVCLTDILNSCLTNLIKNNFLDFCLNRILIENVITDYENNINDLGIITLNCIHDTQYCFDRINLRSRNEFKNDYSSLMISFRVFISNFLIRMNENVSQMLLAIASSILSFLWNLTDKVPLIPMFIETQYPEKTIEWIRTDGFMHQIDALGRPLLNIIYNLSRDKKILKQFHTDKVFDTLIKHKPLIDKQDNDDLKETFGMLLVSLVTNDEQSEENKELILTTTQNLYRWCQAASTDDELTDNGMHLSELLELLYRAFSNTYVMKQILDSDRIQYFVKLLVSLYGIALDPEPDYLEKQAVSYLLKILLQISLYPDAEYVNELVEDAQFCLVIKCLANRPKSGDAKRIWYIIEPIVSPNTSKQTTSSGIYISYDQNDEDFCKGFIKELRHKVTLPVWVAYENVETYDTVWEYSYPVIKSSVVAIVLLSSAYAESTEKFQELSFILSTSKTTGEQMNVIIVNTEPNFKLHNTLIKDLLHGKIKIPYDRSMNRMASKVGEYIVSKKSVCNCLPFRRSQRRHQEETTNRSAPPIPDVEPLIVKNNDNKNVISAERHVVYNIVTSLNAQTRTVDNSSWV